MKLTSQRETLLKPLQAVMGVVERRQTMPILANVLLTLRDGKLAVTATDLEVELLAWQAMEADDPGEITVPGRKLLDICRALPEGAKLTLSTDGDRVVIRSGRSRFTLTSQPASEFPTVEEVATQQTLTLSQADARRLLDKTHFSMAHQDVRYYLNGLLLEVDGRSLRAVATDGHRLALCEVDLGADGLADQQVIVPRKGVLELQRLLTSDGEVSLRIGSNHIQIETEAMRFTSKLIDGRFPDYGKVIPPEAGHRLVGDREVLRQALGRTAILSNEKYRGIRLEIEENRLIVQAHNPEQEEAEEDVEVEYDGGRLEIGFNVNYLLDALGAIDAEQVEIGLTDSNSSCLIHAPGEQSCRYVVMPMRL